MIDLHAHVLPDCDDGAVDLEMSIAMARHAVAQGTKTMACTPHIFPGKYENHGPEIRTRMESLQRELNAQGIDLTLVIGADAHIRPDFAGAVQSGEIPTLGDAGYVLMEPPHTLCPPNLERLVGSVLETGYVPVVTHPERLAWVRQDFATIETLIRLGAALQVTAGSVIGGFGRRAQALSLLMLHRGMVDIVASDAHNMDRRRPGMRKVHKFLTELMGSSAADQLTQGAPAAMLEGTALPVRVTLAPGDWQSRYALPTEPSAKVGILSRLFQRHDRS